MDINDAMKICFKNNVKVYPFYNKTIRMWNVVVDIDGQAKKIPKDLKQKELNNAIKKTYIFYAKKL